MTTYKHLLWFAPVLLVVGVIAAVSIDTPITSLLQSTEVSQPDLKKNVEARNEENTGLKNQDVKQVDAQKEEGTDLKNQEAKQVEVGNEENASLKEQEIKEVEIRKEEEHRLKKQDKLYSQQAKALASRYEETAKMVASNGGDAKPLLDAAAYYENEAK